MKVGQPIYRNILIGYYAVVQLVHFACLLLEFSHILRGLPFTILAPAPQGGWSDLRWIMLVILGNLDAIIIMLSVVFVWGYFKRRPESLRFGYFLLTTFLVTALLYLLVTLPGGAWNEHPWNYGVLVVCFIPILVLYLDLMRIRLGTSQ